MLLAFESVPQQMASLRLLLGYSFESLYCGHAGYITRGKEKMQQKLDYLEELSGEISGIKPKKGWAKKHEKSHSSIS